MPGEHESKQPSPPAPRPPVDFASFLLGLASTALIHLGVAPDPETDQKRPPEPELARETIDLLVLLREKTRGNLTAEEQQFLDTLLHDLRMQYVEATRNHS